MRYFSRRRTGNCRYRPHTPFTTSHGETPTMYTDLKDQLTAELDAIEQAGTFKHERVI